MQQVVIAGSCLRFAFTRAYFTELTNNNKEPNLDVTILIIIGGDRVLDIM